MVSSKSVGRPSLGVTKKVSVTLPEEFWKHIDDLKSRKVVSSYSDFFRNITYAAARVPNDSEGYE